VSVVKAIEEEYWTPQYKTRVDGAGRIFWPEEGTGHYATPEAAELAARRWLESYDEVRVVHVTRRVEYGPSIVRDKES
jgi:hypothetical protein